MKAENCQQRQKGDGSANWRFVVLLQERRWTVNGKGVPIQHPKISGHVLASNRINNACQDKITDSIIGKSRIKP